MKRGAIGNMLGARRDHIENLVGTDWEHQKIQNLVGFREISVSHKRKSSTSAINT
jgi:hypothetical protein